MGSKKYPDPNYFREQIGHVGGSTNAWTSKWDTRYYYSVASDSFFQILEIWSQFFHSPLLSEEGTAKEMKAVNSEHEMLFNSDFWRNLQLMWSQYEEGSCLVNYLVGSLKTLDKPTTRQALLDHYAKYYSSDLMTLCLCHNGSLDEMQEHVIDLFSQVENKKLYPFSLKSYPFPIGANTKPRLIKRIPIQDTNIIKLHYVLPDESKNETKQPYEYLSHLIGHEGENSILEFLKKEGLALSVGAWGSYQLDYCGFLEIECRLTQKGLDNYQRVIDVFQNYFAMLRDHGVQEWIHDELQNI